MYAYPCPEQTRILEHLSDTITIAQLGLDRIEEFARFVFDLYARRIGRRQGWSADEDEINSLIAEELSMAEHGVYMAALWSEADAPSSIIGGYRCVRWQPDTRFAAEKIFDVDFRELARRWNVPVDSLWHGSHFCMDTAAVVDAGYRWADGMRIFQRMARHLFLMNENMGATYCIVESDELVNQFLRRMLKVPSLTLSAPRSYIGTSFVTALDLRLCAELPWVREPVPFQPHGKDTSR